MGPPDGFQIRCRADKFRPSKDDKKKKLVAFEVFLNVVEGDLKYRVSQNSRIPNSERCRGSDQYSKYAN
jgi:hypothetical protein